MAHLKKKNLPASSLNFKEPSSNLIHYKMVFGGLYPVLAQQLEVEVVKKQSILYICTQPSVVDFNKTKST